MAYFKASIKARWYQRSVRGEELSLGNNERRMLRALLSDASHNWTLSEILEETDWNDQVHVAGAGQALHEAGLIEISEWFKSVCKCIVLNIIESPIRGPKGNVEFLITIQYQKKRRQ